MKLQGNELYYYEKIVQYKDGRRKIPIGVYFGIYHNCEQVSSYFNEWFAHKCNNVSDIESENFCAYLRVHGFIAFNYIKLKLCKNK